MKVLVTGYNGQLGYDVVREGIKNKLNIVGVKREDLDITIEKDVNDYINNLKPTVIVHCAAYTAVDKSETDRENCWNVNVEGTKFLAAAAKKVNAKFIYISTDYVYDGKGKSPFIETDIPKPQSYYGLTKYEGEKKVIEILSDYFIVRISWVFGVNGNNFIKTMLKLTESRTELNVVGDQIGSPTYTSDLARLIIEMVHSENYGVYHVTNEGFCSWADLAAETFYQSGKNVKVNAITSEKYPTAAIRPKNSRLSKQKLIDNGFNLLPSWQDAVKRYLKELSLEEK